MVTAAPAPWLRQEEDGGRRVHGGQADPARPVPGGPRSVHAANTDCHGHGGPNHPAADPFLAAQAGAPLLASSAPMRQVDETQYPGAEFFSRETALQVIYQYAANMDYPLT